MYIAYKTTENLVSPERGRLGQFGRAKALMAFAFSLNIVEIVLIGNALFFNKRLHLTGEILFSFYLFPLLVLFFVNMIFKKNTLAKSIKLYKNSKFADLGRGIGLLYIFLNFAIVIFLIYEMRKIIE